MSAVHTSLILVACFGGGALAGWATTHRGGSGSVEGSQVPAQTSSTARSVRATGDDRAKIAAAMAPVRAAKGRWAAIQAAVELAHRIPPDEIHRWLYKDLFQHADHEVEAVFYRTLRDCYFELDPEVCLRDMIARRHTATSQYVERWVELDHAAVIRFIEGQPSQERNRGGYVTPWVSTALRALAQRDPAALLEASANWDKNLRKDARRDAVPAWLKKDFSSCLTWLSGHPEGKSLFLEGLRDSSSGEAGKSLAMRIKELPAGWAAELCKGAKSQSLTYFAGEEWLAADLEGAGVPAGDVRLMRHAAVLSLARDHPERAFEAYANLGDMPDSERLNLIARLAAGIGSKNPELTRRWAEGLDENLRQIVFARIESNTAKKSNDAQQKPDPNRSAAEQLQDVAAGQSNSFNFGSNAGGWSPALIQETVQAIQALPAAQVSSLVGKLDPGGAPPCAVSGELIARQLALAPTENPQKLIRNAAVTGTRWAGEDPAAASRWATSLPAGDARHWAILNTAAQWHRDDPVAAQRWIDKLPEKDRAAAQEGVKK